MFSPFDLSGLLLTHCESTELVVWGDIIGLILSDVSILFAHWICGDVTFSHEGLLLCTDSFTIPECPRLIMFLW